MGVADVTHKLMCCKRISNKIMIISEPTSAVPIVALVQRPLALRRMAFVCILTRIFAISAAIVCVSWHRAQFRQLVNTDGGGEGLDGEVGRFGRGQCACARVCMCAYAGPCASQRHFRGSWTSLVDTLHTVQRH